MAAYQQQLGNNTCITYHIHGSDKSQGEGLQFASMDASKPQFRRLELADYHKGFLTLLSQLTTVGEISESAWEKQFKLISGPDTPYHLYVLEENDRIVASGTVFVESKFIHACGRVGHIEDIVVDESLRGKRLGWWMLQHLTEVAKREGCYKVILDCADHNVGFYEKCGYERKGAEMAHYF